MKGNNTVNATGTYGTVNTANINNKPGARIGAMVWTDASGVFWLFGGEGYGASGGRGYLNDMWRYDPGSNTWTWMKGDNTINATAVYGTINTANVNNKPGARENGGGGGFDASGNLLLFGGYGHTTTSTPGFLSDLWSFDRATRVWTWIKGNQTLNALGDYGTMTVASSNNKPGGRRLVTTWQDSNGDFWLFGGFGHNINLSPMQLGDLWKYSTATGNWTWMKGNNSLPSGGVYGTRGISNANNKPGSRYKSSGFLGTGNKLWLFGGDGEGAFGNGRLNDLWAYDIGTNRWTWMSGSQETDEASTYGLQGVPSANNTPGARDLASAWTDQSGNLWLTFGEDTWNIYNELWKYNVSTNQWTWVRGNNLTEDIFPATYGVQGTSAVANKPGGRYEAGYWNDGASFWLFGGTGRANTFSGYLNDLWRYNSSTNEWTWKKGANAANQKSNYGTMGISLVSNAPGGRLSMSTWKDNNGKLWMFGGSGLGGGYVEGYLNDLWKYDTVANQWTWIKGDSTVNDAGDYGSIGVPSASNKPGARINACTWTDVSGNLWLLGGEGYDNAGISGKLNDLWKYDIATNQWTWIKGNDFANAYGYYGVKGISGVDNMPSARTDHISWSDISGNFWLFGGNGYDTSGTLGYLNDLWKYNTTINEWTWIKGDNRKNVFGVYGTTGKSGVLNKPGGRTKASGWIDINGIFWLFGGEGYAGSGSGLLNDLWKYNQGTNQWQWVKGDSIVYVSSVYGILNTPNNSNKSDGRNGSVAWKDNNSSLWMFGGSGFSQNNYNDNLNDLWKYYLPCSSEITISAISNIVCFDGNPVQLTASGGSSYEWYKDGVLIPGATGPSYSATTTGSYYAKGNAGSCTNVFSNEILLQVPPVAPQLTGTGIYCEGVLVNVGIPVTEISQSYTWLRSGSPTYGPIGGNGGNQSLQFNMVSFDDGAYRVESSKEGCPSVYSPTVNVYYGGITNLSTTAISSNSVSFSWLDYNNPIKKFQYAVTTSSFPPANGINTTSTSVTVGSLFSCVTYYIHVRGATILDLDDPNTFSFCDNWTTISFNTPPAGAILWTGTVDTDWFNPENWTCSFVPLPNSEVVINGSKPHYPVITSNVTVKKLTINSGASVNVEPDVILTITSQ